MWMRYLVLRVLRWNYCPVVNEILDLMTKAVATIGAMAALLMIYKYLLGLCLAGSGFGEG